MGTNETRTIEWMFLLCITAFFIIFLVLFISDMAERKFTRGLHKPGMAAQLRESVSQVVRESAVLVSDVIIIIIAFYFKRKPKCHTSSCATNWAVSIGAMSPWIKLSTFMFYLVNVGWILQTKCSSVCE